MPHPLDRTRISLAPLFDGRGFLRLSRTDDALFVSDAPRRLTSEGLQELLACLVSLDARGVVDGGGLLRVDVGLSRYEALFTRLSDAPAPMPDDDRLLPAYALARVARAHPAPLSGQPLSPLRAALLSYGDRARMTGLADALLPLCAERLRLRQPLPAAAGRVMNAWLLERAPTSTSHPTTT